MNETKQDDLVIRVVWTGGYYYDTVDITPAFELSPAFYYKGKGDSSVFDKVCVHGKVTLLETIDILTLGFPIIYNDERHPCTVIDQSENRTSVLRNAINSECIVGFGDIGGIPILIIDHDMEELYRTSMAFIKCGLWRNYIDVDPELELVPKLVIYGYWELYNDSDVSLTKDNNPCMKLRDIRSYIMNIRPTWISAISPKFNPVENIKNETLGGILNELLTHHNGIVCYDENDTIRRLTDMDEIVAHLINIGRMYICCSMTNPDNVVFTVSCNLALAKGIGQLVLRSSEATTVGYWKEGK